MSNRPQKHRSVNWEPESAPVARKTNPPRKVKARVMWAAPHEAKPNYRGMVKAWPVQCRGPHDTPVYVIPADEASYEAMKQHVDAAAEKAINRWLANGHPKNRERIPVEILASLSIHPPKRKEGRT